MISGNIHNSSNFLNHIQEQHSQEFRQFNSVKSQVGSRKRITDELIREADSAPKSLASAMMMLMTVTVRSLTFLNFLLLPQRQMMPMRMLKC